MITATASKIMKIFSVNLIEKRSIIEMARSMKSLLIDEIPMGRRSITRRRLKSYQTKERKRKREKQKKEVHPSMRSKDYRMRKEQIMSR
jgi:hypothetical protein